MAFNWERTTGIAMRIAVFFFVAVGVGLIVCGCILQNPPKDYGPAMFVAAGSINLFASLAGFWGSYNKKRVLMVFIVFGGLSVVLQIAFEISLFTSGSQLGGRESRGSRQGRVHGVQGMWAGTGSVRVTATAV